MWWLEDPFLSQSMHILWAMNTPVNASATHIYGSNVVHRLVLKESWEESNSGLNAGQYHFERVLNICNFILYFYLIITKIYEGNRWQNSRYFLHIQWHFTFNGVLPTSVNLCHKETKLPSLSHPTILPLWHNSRQRYFIFVF